MNLYIDVGNTTTKFAVDKKDDVKRVLTILSKEILQNKSKIKSIFIKNKIENIYISSVNPKGLNVLKNLLSKLIDKSKIKIIDINDKISYEINIDDKKELGCDLLCDLEGALYKYKEPLLVVDLGTASKVLLMPKNKIFTSCAIIPGIQISLDLLFNSTALIKKVNLDDAKNYLDCHNTKDVIISSNIYAQADAIKGMIERYQKEIGYECKVILTGGYSDLLSKYLDFPFVLEKELSFVGIKAISKRK